MNWVDKLERKYRKYAISDLMKYIVGLTGAVYVLSMLNPELQYKLALVPSLVLKGEVWRVITYIFIPPSSSPIFILFVLYFYYMVGSSLEREWGSFRFNLYYILGMIGTTIAVLITGGTGTATYLNLSLFLAFAYVYPEYQILLFFILPVKIKYLAWLNWAFIGWSVLTAPISYKMAAMISVLNYFVFFGKDVFRKTKTGGHNYHRKKKFKEQLSVKPLVHKCIVCGLTQDDDPKMDFRYCPECDGRRAYCTEHIRNHEHIKVNKVIDFPGNNE
jgi:membrane associated rhomboid family serine protease